jgi:hypothetical protein
MLAKPTFINYRHLLPKKTCQACGLSKLFNWVLPPRPVLHKGAVRIQCQKLLMFDLTEIRTSPKLSLPTEADYRPPSPPPQRDLGPPPPGHGRFMDYATRTSGAGRGFGGGAGAPDGVRRNLDEVLCFKVSHFLLFAGRYRYPNHLYSTVWSVWSLRKYL